jgi:glycosyltransferase involved in cell wall biosynthesis
MKVAIIYLGKKGGCAKYSLEVSRAISERTDVLNVISAYNSDKDKWAELSSQTDVIQTFRGPWEALNRSLQYFRFKRIREKVTKFNPDIVFYPMVHVWTPIINYMLSSIPKVSTIHDPVLVKGNKNYKLAIPQWITLRQVDHLIALTEHTKTQLDKKTPWTNISVVPHGEFSMYNDGNVTEDLEKYQSKTILFFGQIKEYKGFDRLLESFKEIKRRVPKATLVVAGQGDIDVYQDEISSLKGLEIYNEWISDEEVSSFFNEASLTVLPYRFASQSGIIPLSYAHATPVVATDVGGVSDQVVDGETGRLVPNFDRSSFIETCVCLLSAPQKLRDMGERAKRYAERKWSWERIADSLLRTFSDVISSEN